MWLCGCAGYRLGPSNGESAGTRSVEFKPFGDQTLEPRLLEPVAQSLRKGLQRDGTFRLATLDPGDIVVTGTLTDFTRKPLTFQARDLVATRDYEVRLSAHVVATERASGKDAALMRRLADARALAPADLAKASDEALELLASWCEAGWAHAR